MAILSPAHTKKIAYGHFYGRSGFIVPVKPDNGIAPVAGGGHPDMLDGAGTGDLGQREGLLGIDYHERAHFPTLSQFAGRMGSRALFEGGHTAFTGFAGKILGTD